MEPNTRKGADEDPIREEIDRVFGADDTTRDAVPCVVPDVDHEEGERT